MKKILKEMEGFFYVAPVGERIEKTSPNLESFFPYIKNTCPNRDRCIPITKYEALFKFIKLENLRQAERIEELLQTIEKLSNKSENCKILKLH